MASSSQDSARTSHGHDELGAAETSGSSAATAFPVVGIGASAGGIEALIRLFEAMPSDTGMAFLVVMHLDPNRESGLTQVLSQHSAMTIAEAADGMAIEPDHVYVIAPNSSLTVDDGKLRMTEPTERRGVRYPVDRLFESLAIHRRERAICIVLSGSGSDGTEGLKEVKAQGGCILVQDPSTARFDSMPQSAIAANLADQVLAPEHMADVLMRYIRHAYMAGSEVVDQTTNDPSIDPVLALLRSRAGQDFRLYKRSTLTRRIHRRMGLNNLHTLAEYVELLRTRPGELDTLTKDLMINVTGFFRDSEAWTALDESVLAPLVDARDSGAAVRLWVPACATGEEAYSPSSEIATVFLDKDFCIRWFSPASKELLELVDSDIGRPVTHFAWKVADETLLRDAETVLQKLNGIDAEVRSSADRWYLRRLLPYRTHDDRIAGVVITFMDITERKLAVDAINEARLYAEAIIETVRHPVMVLDSKLRVQSVNPTFCEAFACPAETTHGYLLHELDHGAWDIPELRQLLHDTLERDQAFEGFEIEHVFPRLGRRHMLLNARKMAFGSNGSELILLAIEDVTASVEANLQRDTLVGELSHRVKNMLAMVQSIGSQTLRRSGSLEEFKPAFKGRLHALGRAHDLLVAEDWSGADLGQLVRRTLEPYGMSERVTVDGPRLHLAPQAGVAMAMVLNELATNAVKYGALSNQSGSLKVTWQLDGSAGDQRVHLQWIETGGPPVAPPSRHGFGSSLIERSITHQLEGTATPDFRAEGLYYEIAFPWQENGPSKSERD